MGRQPPGHTGRSHRPRIPAQSQPPAYPGQPHQSQGRSPVMLGARDVDVLVVGSGAAGLAAALAARDSGAESVMIAEAEPVVGGSSRLSGGLMMGAGTRYQRAAGITDDPASLFHDYMQLNQWKVEPAVVWRLAEQAGPAVEWLGDLGVEYYDQLVFGGDERVPRVHCPVGRGQAVVDVLTRHCR